MRPRIAIPHPYSLNPEYSPRVWPEYAEAVRLAGGEPVAIALDLDNAAIMKLARTCDAVLLPGSPADVNPEKYDRERDPRTAPADPLRDNVDELLLQDAYNMRKPVLGICFGCQILNVWRCGTLVQHVGNADLHTDKKARHILVVEPGSTLEDIVGPYLSGGRLEVNTSHHQAIEDVGGEMKVVARAEDGTVEAAEGTRQGHWVLAVQWHPERIVAEPAQLAIFEAFVAAARERHADPRLQNDYESLRR